MNQNQLTWEKIEGDYWNRVGELSHDTHWGDEKDGPIREFGCKTQRECDGVEELFTITDYANILAFFHQKWQSREEELVKAVEGLPVHLVSRHVLDLIRTPEHAVNLSDVLAILTSK